jgi:hypothetical protein
MNKDIQAYNNAQTGEYKKICDLLAEELNKSFPVEESKVWHGGPVWFINGNPLAGYWVRKNEVRLLFWSGQVFDEPGLIKEGSFKAAEAHYTSVDQINKTELHRWFDKAAKMQLDYKNIVKNKGKLEKIGNW